MEGVLYVKSGLLRTWTKYYAELVSPVTTRKSELVLRKKQFDGKVEMRFDLDDPLMKVYPYSANDTDIIMFVAEV